MSRLDTSLDLSKAESIGVYQAATMDGYWHDAAYNDLQYVYLLGQLQATKSIHGSYGNNSTRRRIKRLQSEIEEIEKRLIS